MSSQPRPGQATFAVWLIVGGSLLAILTAWQRISGLHSMEMQQELARLAKGWSFGGTPASVSTLSRVMQVLCLIGGGAAAAAAVLGFQVLKRSASARIALTALLPAVVLGWLGTAGYFEPLVMAGIVTLWLPPTHDWYAGRDWMARYRRQGPDGAGRPRRPDPFGPPSLHTPPQQPPAEQRDPQAQPGPVQLATLPPPVVAPRQPVPDRRPPALLTACVLAWAGSLVAALFAVAGLFWLDTSSAHHYLSTGLDQDRRLLGSLANGVTVAQLRAEMAGLLVLVLLWCVAAMVVAGFAFLGHTWARITLAVSAIAAGVGSVVIALTFPPIVLVAVCCAVAARQLFRADVAAWRGSRRR
ncbi:MAG: hypothetical protein FWE71_12450 [Nocardioidaceae bacterium]|nr:hypothetical protein [Nocardioidaceae bacterium]MCL2614950.1 hypothetical protein [Nocardioidaceae bacterium]